MTDQDKLILGYVRKAYKCRNNSEVLINLEQLCDKMRKKVSRSIVNDVQNFGSKHGIPYTIIDDDFVDIQIPKDANKDKN